MIETIEIHGMENRRILCQDDRLLVRAKDPRAWHCETVEEYRLWKFSSDYNSSTGGMDDLIKMNGMNPDYDSIGVGEY